MWFKRVYFWSLVLGFNDRILVTQTLSCNFNTDPASRRGTWWCFCTSWCDTGYGKWLLVDWLVRWYVTSFEEMQLGSFAIYGGWWGSSWDIRWGIRLGNLKPADPETTLSYPKPLTRWELAYMIHYDTSNNNDDNDKGVSFVEYWDFGFRIVVATWMATLTKVVCYIQESYRLTSSIDS